MHSYGARKSAVALSIQYRCKAAAMHLELGYPRKGSTSHWYQAFIKTGHKPESTARRTRYSAEARQKAIDHYFSTGQWAARTIRKFRIVPSRSSSPSSYTFPMCSLTVRRSFPKSLAIRFCVSHTVSPSNRTSTGCASSSKITSSPNAASLSAPIRRSAASIPVTDCARPATNLTE